MKSIYKIAFLVGITILVSSCKDDAQPNYQYMPNMYEPVSYGTYSQAAVFKGGKEGQLPAEGSIKRGFEVYEYPDTPDALIAVKAANLKSPLGPLSDKEKEKAKALYEIYCAICHGNAGDGQGKLVTQGKFLGVPGYKDREINEGSIFHVVTYGLNNMGSHANQLSKKERWMVATYVMELKSK
ncbi:c-type cytochrome [Flavobacterium nackdongense]|uniref:Cytochrome c n=1 Tax=Flavobacterium nackdongense TaxID=2547394 RepID=A0A4P6Y9K1_9FLAO|nr:cytochrome c [Flavobacterium nackdongense]QBN19669.1 cytochrome c [Flavobacterium nackdongense]